MARSRLFLRRMTVLELRLLLPALFNQGAFPSLAGRQHLVLRATKFRLKNVVSADEQSQFPSQFMSKQNALGRLRTLRKFPTAGNADRRALPKFTKRYAVGHGRTVALAGDSGEWQKLRTSSSKTVNPLPLRFRPEALRARRIVLVSSHE